jgi:hypothetical protein
VPMFLFYRFTRISSLLAGFALFVMLIQAQAFPPAPHYTIYGMVRDETGQRLTADGAQIVIYRGTAVVARVPLQTGLIDQNYEVNIKLDHNRSGTALYTGKAIPAQSLYSLAVEIGGQFYYPIEVQGSLTAGKGAERVRLDLNLGEDLDGDGLPDIWEAWQLFQAGHFPDENGLWPIHLINRNGDFDGDGLSNWLEYIAGTFAGDAAEKFGMEVKERLADGRVRCEFFGITGKTYAIDASLDMKTWSRMPFSVGTATAADNAHVAAEVGIRSVFLTPPAGSAKQFYRLTVR